ncbi:pentatricopeptide repeat-containing protein At3g29230-like [Cucurbita pepo subsp. pepo]|uniref:pentatricopeptide repeat-containing protein At3g29230-like n=1 Tax=Cucurbita pepo subsp. pepo TaxID=3664 RepID=UPI000C9D9F44|nr:pentatricopeptide repeat-containing protein At3g29230-like [Cucurbita pepo subsp. pepo]
MNGLQLGGQISEILPRCSFVQLKQIHALLLTSSIHQSIHVFSSFLRRTTELGTMDYASLVFSHLNPSFRTEVQFWNAMVRGYAFNGPVEKSVSLYGELLQRGLKPHNFTYPYVLNSCADLGWFWDGKKVHCRIIKTGFSLNYSVSDALLNLYLKISEFSGPGAVSDGKVWDARKLFDEMRDRTIEVWNRMILVYMRTGDVYGARQLFDSIEDRDVVSWNTMISGYVKVRDIAKARELFEQMPEKNIVSWTSMIGAYAKAGDIITARMFFNKMPQRNVVSWNSMVSSYVQHRDFQEARNLFIQMLSEGITPDRYTFVSVLSACSHLGDLEFGKWIHYLIDDFSQLGVISATALVEMYAKCGDINRAFTIFIKIGTKDVFCWNVMLKSLALHGKAQDAIKLLSLMQKEGLKPNDFTFLGALFACSHGGMTEEGQIIFDNMQKEHGISPTIEHYGCVIDLLSRNGRLEEALRIVDQMPFEPDVAIWGALLGGCKLRSDFKRAEEIVERVRKLRSNEGGIHVSLSNMYASVEHWQEALTAREKMEEENILKKTGQSSVIYAPCGSSTFTRYFQEDNG